MAGKHQGEKIVGVWLPLEEHAELERVATARGMKRPEYLRHLWRQDQEKRRLQRLEAQVAEQEARLVALEAERERKITPLGTARVAALEADRQTPAKDE